MTKILDAACELFARNGVRATTLDALSAAAGVGRGQLYHYFDDQTDLIAAVVADQVNRVVDEGVTTLGRLTTGRQLRRVGTDIARHYAQADRAVRCPVGALVYELGPDDVAARAAVAAGIERWRAAWCDTVTRLQDSAQITSTVDPESTATAILATYQGAILLAAAAGDTTIIRTSIDAVVTPLLAAAA